MKYMTKKAAREEIERNKDLTSYFVGNLKAKDFKELLRYRMNFGEAETNTILAALVLAGAKFEI